MPIRIGTIVESVKRGSFRCLSDIKLCCNDKMQPIYHSGSSAVVFMVEREGVRYSMRCYRNARERLREIYGTQLYESELRVSDRGESKWLDVVMVRWIDGETLQQRFDRVVREDHERGLAKSPRLLTLSRSFDRMASALIEAPWAHGDISPDNIIIDEGGEMQLIDSDSKYIESFSGMESLELGTPSYQSPMRGQELYHARMDDFSLALISISLRAVAESLALWSHYHNQDALLLDATEIYHSDNITLCKTIDLLACNGCFAHYAIACKLQHPITSIPELPELLSYGLQQSGDMGSLRRYDLDLFSDKLGRWGYCEADSGDIIIPPLFNYAEPFHEGIAIVEVEMYRFQIDCLGRIIEWQ